MFTHTHKNIQMFIAALCITAENSNNRISLSIGVDKQTVVYPFTEILLSNKKEQSIHATTWILLKRMVLSERSQAEKATFCMISILEKTNYRIREHFSGC